MKAISYPLPSALSPKKSNALGTQRKEGHWYQGKHVSGVCFYPSIISFLSTSSAPIHLFLKVSFQGTLHCSKGNPGVKYHLGAN